MVDTRDEYQELFNIYWPIGVGVFLVIAAVIAFAVIRYRSARNEFPEGRDESKPLEGSYVLVLVLVAAGLLFFTYSTMSDIEEATSGALDEEALAADPLEVEVTAARWNWRFVYPEEGISAAGTDAGAATLVVPAGRPVRFHLTSLDVIHSFFIPELRFKRDAFPDRETVFALEFEDVGFHQGAGECAEYCGLRHSYMDFNVDVKEAEDFDGWVDDKQAEEERASEGDLEPTDPEPAVQEDPVE